MDNSQTAAAFKALGDPTRLQVFQPSGPKAIFAPATSWSRWTLPSRLFPIMSSSCAPPALSLAARRAAGCTIRSTRTSQSRCPHGSSTLKTKVSFGGMTCVAACIVPRCLTASPREPHCAEVMGNPGTGGRGAMNGPLIARSVQLISKPPETTHFPRRWRRPATWDYSNGLEATRADSLTIAAGGLQGLQGG